MTTTTELLTRPFSRADRMTRAIRGLHIKSAVKWAAYMATITPDWQNIDQAFADYLLIKLRETQMISHLDN